MEEELDHEINAVLAECQENGWINQTEDTPDIRDKAIRQSEIFELIRPKGRNSFELTIDGQKAIELGGYKEYRSKIKSKNTNEDLIQNLTIKNLKGNIFQVRYWWLILLLSGIIGFITGNFDLILKWFEKN